LRFPTGARGPRRCGGGTFPEAPVPLAQDRRRRPTHYGHGIPKDTYRTRTMRFRSIPPALIAAATGRPVPDPYRRAVAGRRRLYRSRGMRGLRGEDGGSGWESKAPTAGTRGHSGQRHRRFRLIPRGLLLPRLPLMRLRFSHRRLTSARLPIQPASSDRIEVWRKLLPLPSRPRRRGPYRRSSLPVPE